MTKKRLIGLVTSTKMDKTVVVNVETAKRHKMYKKLVYSNKKYKARDDMEIKVGDRVVIEECQPLSKTVSWKVVEKLEEGVE